MGDKTQVGDKFICAVCRREDVVEKSHADLVANFELVYGREYDPRDPDIVLVCNDCSKLLARRASCGKPASPPSRSSGGTPPGVAPTG